MRLAIIDNGVIANVALADTVDAIAGAAWLSDKSPLKIGDVYDENMALMGESPPKKLDPLLRITRLAFRQRFTMAERVAIEQAAESDATIRTITKDQDAATYISLGDPNTTAALGLLRDASLITQERMDAILTAPVQDAERPE